MKEALQKEVVSCFTAIMLRYDKAQKNAMVMSER